MLLTWTWLTCGLGSVLADRLLGFRYEAAESQCSVSHSLTSPDVYLRNKQETSSRTKQTELKYFSLYKKAGECYSRAVAHFPSQAEKFVSSSIPDVILSPLNHFPSHTFLLYSLWLLVILFFENLCYTIFRGLRECCLSGTFHPIPLDHSGCEDADLFPPLQRSSEVKLFIYKQSDN